MANIKYSLKFENDYNWYKLVSDKFNFDGCGYYFNKKGIDLIQPDENGLTAKECFYRYDSEGKIFKTKEPEELELLLKTKGSVNLHIKMFAEDRAKGYLPKYEFDKIVEELNPPKWFVDAVENQKFKYYEF